MTGYIQEPRLKILVKFGAQGFVGSPTPILAAYWFIHTTRCDQLLI